MRYPSQGTIDDLIIQVLATRRAAFVWCLPKVDGVTNMADIRVGISAGTSGTLILQDLPNPNERLQNECDQYAECTCFGTPRARVMSTTIRTFIDYLASELSAASKVTLESRFIKGTRNSLVF